MVLIRLTDYWRILGAVHSNLNYMENELVAKPTPERNPLLSQKINMLYHLLTSQSTEPRPVIATDVSSSKEAIMATYGIVTADDEPIIEDALTESDDVLLIAHDDNDSYVPPNKIRRTDVDVIQFVHPGEDSSSSDLSATMNVDQPTADTNAQGRVAGDIYGSYAIESDAAISVDDASFDRTPVVARTFENEQLRLKLPIKIEPTQRLLMIELGDDFTHIWFPAWRRILRRERILAGLAKAKANGTTIDLSHPQHASKVVVTHTHERCIFIGPYDLQSKQNVGLFMQHNGQMVQTRLYDMEFPDPNRVKSKGKSVHFDEIWLKSQSNVANGLCCCFLWAMCGHIFSELDLSECSGQTQLCE